MEYRKLGKTGLKLSSVGLGTVRLPVVDGDFSQIDFPKAKEIIRYGIDCGINYIDTAYPYHFEGNAERALKEILKDGYRERVYVGNKMPLWLLGSLEECKTFFYDQLERTTGDCFELYFLHSLDKKNWKLAQEWGVLAFLEELKEKGLIHHIGFSFHDDFEVFKEILDAYPWDFCLIQLNYMDMGYQAGIKGLEYAGEKGLGVLIMEPLKGGQLARDPSQVIKNMWQESRFDFSPPERGLAFLLDRAEVTCVLSGMNEREQIEVNTALSNKVHAGFFDAHEKGLYSRVAAEYARIIKIGCTRCQYCMPCPAGVDIPTNIEYYNMAHIYNSVEFTRNYYNRPIFDPKRSTNCTGCGLCKERCPQHLDVPEIMKMISDNWAVKK